MFIAPVVELAVKTLLDRFYTGLAALAGLCLVMVLLIQLAAIVGRFAHFTIEGHDAYAGYFLAAASFLAMAYALRSGDHIRVTLLISRLVGRRRYWAELLDLILASVISLALAGFSLRLAWGSWRFEDVSQNVDATPLWIPQIAMALGTCALALAFVEELVSLVMRGQLPPETPGEIARTE